jgi:glycosyltransferase involved in cell wall biosynthesis
MNMTKHMAQKSHVLFYLFVLILMMMARNETVFSAEAETKKTVCLNMIVKDESQVITRCLDSVKPLIDYWVIFDTGSSDGTQDIIREYMQDIPGELHESPWINFAYNRNEALNLAKKKGDYILFIDADETLEYPSDYDWPELDKDRFDVTMVLGDLQYSRVGLVKSDLDWEWYGVLHEYLYASQCKTIGQLTDIFRTSKSDGHRSRDPNKFLKDAAVLEAALMEEPDNYRYRFYLAQSYRDAGEYDLAIENYQKRVAAGGWAEEVFISLLQIARLQHALNKDPKTVIDAFYTAYTYRPSRAEPLCDLAKYYRSLNMFDKAYRIASIGMSIPYSEDKLFVEVSPYEYDLALECSVAAYWIGNYEKCQEISKQLLLNPRLPPNVRKIVEANLNFANARLVEEIQYGEENHNESESSIEFYLKT